MSLTLFCPKISENALNKGVVPNSKHYQQVNASNAHHMKINLTQLVKQMIVPRTSVWLWRTGSANHVRNISYYLKIKVNALEKGVAVSTKRYLLVNASCARLKRIMTSQSVKLMTVL